MNTVQMNRWVVPAIAVLLAGCVTSAPTPAADEAAVIETLHAACRAYRAADANAIEALLTPDFTLTDADGVVTTRADDIANAKSGGITYTLFENRDMKVRLHGDAALVTGITEVRGSAGGSPFAAIFQFTDTLVRQEGRWRVAASHISRLPKI